MRNYQNMISIDEFIGSCRGWLVMHYDEYVKSDPMNAINLSEIFVVWYSAALGNHKCILATTRRDNIMVECTYDRTKARIYFDVYNKAANVTLEL